ncbi:MAG: hypothetical protein LC135_16775 [Phycisphaerae bacterium]|nr:hypothetical protein [Phycisphaerae bacterium]MCZ2401495.1 hypothetical protein [Phycisphaerae bacterium]NUQ48740.1 hypothetical protein [Phycisphaerae bacterium]
MQKSASKADGDLSFASHATQVIARLRSAFADVLDPLPVSRLSRRSQLAEVLGIDRTLAWKISKFIEGNDPFAAARVLPGSAGVNIFLRAASRCHAPRASIEAARKAFQDFRALIQVHAGDRKSFGMMLAGYVRENAARADMEHRKQAFQANSYLWGVQAATQLDTYLVNGSANEDLLDVAVIRGFVNLRRIRPHVPWRIARLYSVNDVGELRTSFAREPLDPSAPSQPGGADLPLLSQFCSKLLPRFQRVSGPRGAVEYELAEAPVGNTASHTCMIGETVRGIGSRYRAERDWQFVVRARMRTPCEASIFDLIIHRELFGRITPHVELFSELFAAELDCHYEESDRLPVHEGVRYLGCGPEVVRTPEVPRYTRLIEYAFERLGWDGRQFDVYRVRLQFPVVPSAVLLKHPLASRA